jgi:hypothetical protein
LKIESPITSDGSKLNALKRQIKSARQSVGERRFADAGNVFDEQMTFGEQGDERVFDGFGFAFDNRFNRRLKATDFLARVESRARLRLHYCFRFARYPISHFFIKARRLKIYSTKFRRVPARLNSARVAKSAAKRIKFFETSLFRFRETSIEREKTEILIL